MKNINAYISLEIVNYGLNVLKGFCDIFHIATSISCNKRNRMTLLFLVRFDLKLIEAIVCKAFTFAELS